MKLTYATREAIKYACINFHYAKAIPVNTIGYNVYNDRNEWCGVVLFGTGAAKNIGHPYGLFQGQVLELVRVALNGKQSCTSKVVAEALKQLKKDCPLCRLVVSYADCDQNHLGTIYQATNWLYCGKTDVGDTYFIINGKKTHRKSVHGITINGKPCPQTIEAVKMYLDKNASVFYTKGKRKYLFPLDKKMKKQIEPLRQPYPKEDEGWKKIDRNKFKSNGND